MKGWTPDGQEVELTPRQAECVRALLSRRPEQLPARGFGFGWSTALHTAARYDQARRHGRPLEHDPGLTDGAYADSTGDFADPADLVIMRDRVTADCVRRWYDIALTLPQGLEARDAGEDRRSGGS